jgi:hypothetical protein
MAMALEDEILEELVRTGYPTEIVSASVMQARGWAVFHNPSYLDDREGKSREFDIRAYRQMSKQNNSVGIYLITECKKSDKPWVFFTTPAEYPGDARLGALIRWSMDKKQAFSDTSHADSLIPDRHLPGFHHYFSRHPPRLARTFHQPFKGADKSEYSPMIYTAVMSAVKATLFLCSQPPASNWLGIYYPVVVFSGDLFEAQVSPDKTITLAKSEFLQLSFTYITPTVLRGRESAFTFIIDVVHENYLADFLKTIEIEHEQISEYVFDAIGK